ncbi:MerR family transcriptional regulator [Paenibacillus timonensis]|jgi:DNA-binding transcriptional MerR regulator|uniref:MerR family transcriptional regulator n=1 Tax=Paenibacillus timonensis TaxID=225915 RepID=A0ABW3S6J0_9BACL|nr:MULTISPECIES: MerR family transcriptional regulator [Paenibacillus]MCH1640349.1 MerR family transcriptional regulator [Paenibacillus timonensis]MDU2239997.1 MerR family transcriptional regulator [Paenibacillus sp.]GJM81370.1 MerR family transcriptional regulator [Paenibacillus sp. HMSSN-139]
MKYCIGEFSSLLGITRDTLRLYEKHEIVKPVKDRHNSYRYFNDLDARDLLMSRWYRSMQIPLQDVAGLIQNASLGDILDKMESSRQELEEEIRKSTMLLHKLVELSGEVQSLESRLFQCKLVDRPGLYRLKQTDKNNLLNTKGLEGTINALMEMLPYSFYCFRIEQDTIESEEDLMDYSWGLSISEEEVRQLGIALDEHLEYIPPSRCVSSVILSPQGEHFSKEAFRFMLDYMDERQYAVSGAVTGRLMLTETHQGTKRSFLEIHIPIVESY